MQRVTSSTVVLDACVLIPAALRDTLLRAAQQGIYRPAWSEHILGEVGENLVENGLTDQEGAARMVTTLHQRIPRALITDFAALIPQMPTRDPDDRHVLAAAVAADAEAIITSNLRDFPSEAIEPFGIEVWHPDTFLTSLLDLTPQQIRAIIIAQAAALKRPPLTVEDIVNRLARDVPNFAARIHRITEQR